MFLVALSWFAPAGGFPRVSGDVPAPAYPTDSALMFSPRERGCS